LLVFWCRRWWLRERSGEHRFGLRTAFVPWEGFHVPRDELPFHLLLGPGAWQRKSFPWVIPVDVNDRVGRGQVAVPTQYLPISSADLLAELRTYSLTRRNLQPFLGTAQSLEWVVPPDGYVV
jgi:hypothetical protein